MKVSWCDSAIDLASTRVMLCDVCRRAIARIRTLPPGSHHGSQPQFFSPPPRHDVWTGSHHSENDSFLESVRGRCYICYPILQACPRKKREYAVYFRTFYEIELCGSDHYALRITIELPQLSPLIEAQVIELHGTFQILPRTGT